MLRLARWKVGLGSVGIKFVWLRRLDDVLGLLVALMLELKVRLGEPIALPMPRETRERLEGVRSTELVPVSKNDSSEGAEDTCFSLSLGILTDLL